MGNNFDELIQSAITEDSLVAIYSNREKPHEFSVGYILRCSSGHVLQKSVSTNGFDDGYLLVSFNDIFLLELDSIYLRNIMECHNQNQNVVSSEKLDFSNSTDLLSDVIEYCNANQIMVTLSMFSRKFHGFVCGVEGALLRIINITEEGAYNGISYLRLSDIESLRFGSIEDKHIGELIPKE